MKPLPQQRERPGAIQQPGVDPGAAKPGVDLLGQPQALDRRVAVGPPRRPPARAGDQLVQLRAGVVDHRPIRDRDPPAGGDRGLLGSRGGDHRLGGRAQQPLARPREL